MSRGLVCVCAHKSNEQFDLGRMESEERPLKLMSPSGDRLCVKPPLFLHTHVCVCVCCIQTYSARQAAGCIPVMVHQRLMVHQGE